MPTYQEISRAYWPNPALNESAIRADGNAVVDSMTLSELVEFFKEHEAGPTYCLVKERMLELLDLLPPRLHIIAAKQRAQTALETLRQSLGRLERESIL